MQRLGVNLRVRQLGKGGFRSDLTARRTACAGLFSGRINKAVLILLEPLVGTVCLLFPPSVNGHLLASGHNVANDTLVVVPSGSGADIVTPGLVRAEAIAVPEARFDELTDVLCPTP